MRRRSWLVAPFIAIGLAACGTGSPVDVMPSGPIDPIGPIPTWQPDRCQPGAEPLGVSVSNLTLTGTCPIHQSGPLLCHAGGDDFYLAMKRRLANGLPLTLYVNVESYHGPDTYPDYVEFVMVIQDGQGLFRWSNLRAALTVGPGERSATLLAPVELQPEPGSRASGTEIVSGTIGCIPG